MPTRRTTTWIAGSVGGFVLLAAVVGLFAAFGPARASPANGTPDDLEPPMKPGVDEPRFQPAPGPKKTGPSRSEDSTPQTGKPNPTDSPRERDSPGGSDPEASEPQPSPQHDHQESPEENPSCDPLWVYFAGQVGHA